MLGPVEYIVTFPRAPQLVICGFAGVVLSQFVVPQLVGRLDRIAQEPPVPCPPPVERTPPVVGVPPVLLVPPIVEVVPPPALVPPVVIAPPVGSAVAPP